MTWLLREEVDTSHYQDAEILHWPLCTYAKRLRIDCVEYDVSERVGLIWYRDVKPQAPEYSMLDGICTFYGYRWDLTLVRVTHHSAELPSGLGALAGRFPDRHRGRWFVFVPRESTASAERREPHRLSPSGSAFVDPTPAADGRVLRVVPPAASGSGGNGQPVEKRESSGFMVAEENTK